jgi:hypothetical protein
VGAIGSESHSWRNQNKNATDFTDLPKILDHVLGPLDGTPAGAAPQLRHQVAPIQTHHPLSFLNPWNPWRFCFLAQFALKAAASY